MTSPASITNQLSHDLATVAQHTFATAQRRRAEAAAEARLAQARLAAAEEEERHARHALRDGCAGGTSGAAEMVGMGYFPDEVMAGEAA